MKFVDEATIDVIAGNGGNGCMSFRREKFIPFGGPNGGDGGRGGSVYAVGDRNLNTLIDFRYARRHEARNGESGRGSDQYGAAADDMTRKLLQDHVKATIAPFKYPRSVKFVAALPKTQTGKIQRFRLKEGQG